MTRRRLTPPLACGAETCSGATCRYYLPGHGDSVVHREGACVLAVVEAQSLLGEPCMQRVEVAAWLGVSPQRVTQIEQRAAEKIRAALGEVVER